MNAHNLWRLRKEGRGLAACRFTARSDGRCELRVSTSVDVRFEHFASIYNALARAMEIEAELLRQGWRKCFSAGAQTI